MPEVAAFPLKEMNKVSRKVKWKAGEMRFIKDYLLRTKERKQTAVDMDNIDRKWYRRLYDLSHMGANLTSLHGRHNPYSPTEKPKIISTLNALSADFDQRLIPNSSIVTTKSVIDNVKAKTGIDLMDPKTAVRFCHELFLISFVVIDTDAESVKLMIPDMGHDFEIHSLASIKKQLATLDTVGDKTREAFKILGK
jgi:hypothetical protein